MGTVWFNPIQHTYFGRCTERILVLPQILLRELVYVLVRAFFGNIHNAAPNGEMTIRIVGVDNVDADAGVTTDVTVFDASFG